MKKQVAVRRARPEESDRIAQIADAVNVKTYAYLGKGFLVYTLSPDEYRKRIADGQHVYVFLVNDEILGYVCGYDRRHFETYLSDGTLGHEPAICRKVEALAAQRGDDHYVFLDQIAVLPQYQDQGVAEVCFKRFCAEVPGPYYVAMVEGPLRNPRIAYWCARGFLRLDEVDEDLADRFMGDGPAKGASSLMRWGIYELPPGGFRPIRENGLRIADGGGQSF